MTKIDIFDDIAPAPKKVLEVEIRGKARPFRKFGAGHMLVLKERFKDMEAAFSSGSQAEIGKLMSRNPEFSRAVIAMACAPAGADDKVIAKMEANLSGLDPFESDTAALSIITRSLPEAEASFGAAQVAAAPGNRKARRAASSRTGKAKPRI